MPAPVGSDSSDSMALSEESRVLVTGLESARDLLARRLVLECYTVSDPDLNYVTVSSLLQVLFLKTGQEYGLVEPGTLRALAGCDGIAKRMARACEDAGLSPEQFFDRGPLGSRSFPGLPDEPLRGILDRMDQPGIPVPGPGLPLEEFAAVLDLFLGTRVQASEGCRVHRVGKSSLLYTGRVDIPPQAIIEYVAREAVEGVPKRSPAESEQLCRILDPACGAGLFLLAACRHLVRNTIPLSKSPDQVYETLQDLAGGSFFGTDIDPESVSAARFVLLLSLLEENRRSGAGVPAPGQIRRTCSCLTKTIRCGNALIGPGYFSKKPEFPFNAAERRIVNPFDWKEAFPQILEQGGFDAVIGAPPPYRPFAVPAREEYFQTHYETYFPSAGLYGYFIERGLSLLQPRGILSVLVPGTFLRSRHARPLRRYLLSRQIAGIASTARTRPLHGGDVVMYLLSLRNQPPGEPCRVIPAQNSSGSPQDLLHGRHAFTLDQRLLDDGGWKLEDTRAGDILKKIQVRGTPLDQYLMGEIVAGVHSVRNNPLVVDPATKHQLTRRAWWCRHLFVPLLRPGDIRRYVPQGPDRFVLEIRNPRDLRKCRAVVTYLEHVRELGRDPFMDDGQEHPAPAPDRFMSGESERDHPQIIFSPCQFNPAFCYDPKGSYAVPRTLLTIPRDDPFLVGILNSSLGRFVLTRTCPFTERGYHISPASLGKFPVYVPDFDNPDDKARHDRMAGLVREMLELHKHRSHAKTDRENLIITQDMESTDRQIDSLVYGLYGLTADEITVVEEAVGGKDSPS